MSRDPTVGLPVLNVKEGLVQVAKQMLAQLPQHYLENLTHNMTSLQEFSLGTMCSGTDVCAMATSALLQAVNEVCHKQVVFDHKFSCELKVRKRAFIEEFSSPTMLFENIECMGEQRALDLKSGATRMIPPVSLVAAGFVCKDVSSMQKDRSSALGLEDTIGYSLGQ